MDDTLDLPKYSGSTYIAGDAGMLRDGAPARPPVWAQGSTAELLSTVLATGRQSACRLDAAERLLQECGGLGGLAQSIAGSQEGAGVVPPVAARRLAAALELGRRLLLEPPATPFQVRSPHDIGPLLVAEMAVLEQECLRVVVLNTKNHVLAILTVSVGGISQTPAQPRDIFREAIRRNATSVIIAHNHPSCELTPSLDDVALTREIVAAGVLLGIEVLDHLVVARGGYVSLRERRLGFG
jgi:DNA repair protein RadC